LKPTWARSRGRGSNGGSAPSTQPARRTWSPGRCPACGPSSKRPGAAWPTPSRSRPRRRRSWPRQPAASSTWRRRGWTPG